MVIPNDHYRGPVAAVAERSLTVRRLRSGYSSIAVPAVEPETSIPAQNCPRPRCRIRYRASRSAYSGPRKQQFPPRHWQFGPGREGPVPIRLPKMTVPFAEFVPLSITIPFPELPEITLPWLTDPPIVLNDEESTVIPVPLAPAWLLAAVTPR